MRIYSAFTLTFGALLSTAIFGCSPLKAQDATAKAPMNLSTFETLPNPFVLPNGQHIATPGDWAVRRDEIKTLLAFYEYGHLPPAADVRVIKSEDLPDENGARHQKITLGCGADNALQFALELRIPKNQNGPFPIILTGDAFPLAIGEEVSERGYIVARFDRAAFAPDDDSRKGGIYAIYPDADCGTLGGWAWGYSRAIDYLTTRPDVAADKIIVVGHSRGGKAALVAGAYDERIALTVGAQSGTGGAAPFRLQGKHSESLAQATGRFNHWFGPRLKQFAGREAQLPFDQNYLLALIAPRNLLLFNAFDDPYSNVAAADQTFLASREVFDFLGVPNNIGLHLREGKHSFEDDDWRALLDFGDRQFFGRKTQRGFAGLTSEKAELPFDLRAPKK